MSMGEGSSEAFEAGMWRGHMLRTAARGAALATTQRKREDAEGVEDIDLAASASPRWKAFLRELNAADEQALRIWRGGAIGTPTRRHWRPLTSGADAALAACPHCGAAGASARHFFVECGRYAAMRAQLAEEYSLDPGWWAAQPRVTSKTGWITYAAAATPEGRSAAQIAACRLGLRITQQDGCA